MPRHNFYKSRSRAFSLLEMSIILLLVGIITIGAITTFNVDTEQQQYTATQSKLKVIQDALVTFLAVNGRLPCPASPIQALATATFGKEQITLVANDAAQCTTSGTGILSVDSSGGANIDTLYYGTVPVRDLGLADDNAIDAFGNRIGYVVQRAFINSNATNVKCRPGFLASDANNDNRYMCYRAQASGSGNLTTTDLDIIPNYGSSTYSSRDAVYVLISHGANGYGAFRKDADGSGPNVDRNGYPPASNNYQAEMENLDCNPSTLTCGGSINTTFVSRYRNKFFDDVVVYANRNDMLNTCNQYSQIISSDTTPASTCFNTFGIIPD